MRNLMIKYTVFALGGATFRQNGDNMNYIDIHCHILSGVDDGAQSDAEMYTMLDEAYADGTRTICFTPHYNPAYFGETHARSAAAYSRALEYVREHYPDMTLYIGNELFYYDGCVNALIGGECRTMNGTRYVLVDFPFDASFGYIYSALRELISSGYLPVFAHVERYDCVKPPFRNLTELREMGVVIQINSTSLRGDWGRGIQKKTVKLLRRHIPQILASDAHGGDVRHPRLGDCAEQIKTICDETYADDLLRKNPLKIIGIK